MREIKFRGRQKDNSEWGEWVEGHYYTIRHRELGICHYISSIENNDCWIVDPKTVGQFTGLKAEKGYGEDIYESDLIKRLDGIVYAVVWRKLKGQWWLREYTKDKLLGAWSKPLWECTDEQLVIYSSIHENPELLEDKP